MRRFCAWCRSAVDGLGPVMPLDRVTHTICDGCADAQFAEWKADRLAAESGPVTGRSAVAVEPSAKRWVCRDCRLPLNPLAETRPGAPLAFGRCSRCSARIHRPDVAPEGGSDAQPDPSPAAQAATGHRLQAGPGVATAAPAAVT